MFSWPSGALLKCMASVRRAGRVEWPRSPSGVDLWWQYIEQPRAEDGEPPSPLQVGFPGSQSQQGGGGLGLREARLGKASNLTATQLQKGLRGCGGGGAREGRSSGAELALHRDKRS